MVKPKSKSRKGFASLRAFHQCDNPEVAAAAAPEEQEQDTRRSARRSPRRSGSSSNSSNNNDEEAAAAVSSSSKKRKRAASSSGASKKSRTLAGDSRRSSSSGAAAAGNNAPDSLSALCRMLVEAAPKETRGGVERTVPVDEQKAANILEATAGNVGLAVHLYWEDYFASSHHRNRDPPQEADANPPPAAAAAPKDDAEEEEEDRKPPARRRKPLRRRESNDHNEDAAPEHGEEQDEDDAMIDTDESSGEERKNERKRLARFLARNSGRDSNRASAVAASRRLRRSLDPDFRAADRPLRRQEDPEGEYDEGDYAQDETDNVQLASRADEELGDEHNDDQPALNRRNEAPFHLIGERGAESSMNMSSEDEAPKWGRRGSDFQIGRLGVDIGRTNSSAVRHAAASMEQRIKDAAEEISNKVLKHIGAPEEGVRRAGNDSKCYEPCDDDNNDDYMDDRDWLEDEGMPVIDSLWGNANSTSRATGSDGNEDASNNPVSGARNNNDGHGDGEDDNGMDAENFSDDPGEEESGIPHTWLNAGFQLSECGTGLVVRMPKVEEIEFIAWRQQQNASRRNEAPPPFHCRALTSILSTVTALLYTGASVQGNVVNCESGKKPWASLTLEEKKREFDDRLADALTSLIHIAATSSMERKRKALRKQQKKMKSAIDLSEVERAKEKKMQARLNLVPTCLWEEDLSASLVPRALDGPAYRRVPVKTSWTNIQDIKLYVISTMRSFTARGGVALLLETLLRIHGSHWVSRQIRKVRSQQLPELKDESAPSVAINKSCCLVRCTCEKRQKEMLGGKPLTVKIRNDPEQLIKLLTPPGNECVSVELLSLILTGNIVSSWRDCSISGLGVGLLTDHIREVSISLSRPDRPVWILRGETCYSVAFIKEDNDMDVKTIAKLDRPMTSMHFCQWNGWYGETDKTEFRVITATTDPSPPSARHQKLDDVMKALKFETETRERIRLERKRKQLVHAVSIEQQQYVEASELKNQIQPIELQRLKIHPEDQSLFPNKRHMWRYDMGQDGDHSASTKRPAVNWLPHHRLNERQKRIVEIRLGPKINKILWTRWPTATIDSFTNDPVV